MGERKRGSENEKEGSRERESEGYIEKQLKQGEEEGSIHVGVPMVRPSGQQLEECKSKIPIFLLIITSIGHQ